MNKQECKKYLKRAYNSLADNNKSLNVINIEYEMKSILKEQMTEYIAYSKIAIHNMKNSANESVELEDLLEEIDILSKLYNTEDAVEKAKNL